MEAMTQQPRDNSGKFGAKPHDPDAPRRVVSLKVSENELTAIDKAAKAEGQTRQGWVRSLIRSSLKLTALAALLGAESVQALDLRAPGGILNPIVKTSADLAAEGKNCNFFGDKPFVRDHYVRGEKHVLSSVMTTTSGFMMSAKAGGISAGLDAPYYKTDCTESRVRLFCTKGSCIVSMKSGDHGYSPGERSTVLIDDQRFTWIGDMPTVIGRQMWAALRDGSVVKSSLSLWPSDYTNHKDVVQGVQELKNRTYQLSLGEVD